MDVFVSFIMVRVSNQIWIGRNFLRLRKTFANFFSPNRILLLIYNISIFLFVCSLIGCNQAKALNIDASSSAFGAFLSGGNSGLFGDSGNSVSVTVTGYLNVNEKQMNLTLIDNTAAMADQDLQITQDGTYSFATSLNPNSSYTITQGDYTGGQNCKITGEIGTAGVSASAKIDCERILVVAAVQICCSSSVTLFSINHQTSPFSTVQSIPLASTATLPSAVDLIWNGKNYLVIWMASNTNIVGQLFDIELTPLGPSFSVYSGGTATQKAVAATYNSNLDEFGVVISESTPAVKYIRLSALGTLIGPVTTIEAFGATVTFGNLDIVWDGTKYITAFEEHNTGSFENSLAIYSFTTGAAAFINRITLATGTGLVSPSNRAPNGVIGVALPNFLRTSTDTWLFFNHTNLNVDGFIVDSSLMEWRNFAGSPTQIARDFQPSACNPTSDPVNGLQFYAPSTANFGNKVLLNYTLNCEEAISDPFLFDNVYHASFDPANGAKGPSTLYTTSIGHNRTYGSSVTCRKERCFTSAGVFLDGFYLFDPGFDGSIDSIFRIATSSNGQGFITVIQ